MDRELAVCTKDLKYIYSPDSPFEYEAISNMSIHVKKGSFTCIIGHTGCGKSTLIQHFNGLLKPTEGKVFINGEEVTPEVVRTLRRKVGLLFQYPEHQLFEETVYKDVAFGLKKLDLSEEEVNKRVTEAIAAVGLDDDIKERSIYELSGGQKRRVAIAGVLVMEPEILVLDEPAAGLDPRGRDEIFKLIKDVKEKRNITVILVSHSMEDVANLADYIIVLNKGNLAFEGTPEEIFSKKEELEKIGLAVPQITQLMYALNSINPNVNVNCFTVKQAVENIIKLLKGEYNAE